ncbi:MAG TPA: hypothetical protein VLZ83_12730 [Edaphocola sp.]|nr:hypothetical protein [Edaphocola sp.]
MIDFIRLKYQDRDKMEMFLTSSDNFEHCYQRIERHTGEILYPYKVYLHKMELCVNPESVFGKNSLHKMANYIEHKEDHNYNDFSYKRLCNTIDYLNRKVIDSCSAKITQLEFGLNILTPVPAKKIIANNVLFHKYGLHNVDSNFNGKGKYKQFEYSNFYIKIYDKAKQYNLDANILRFEIKYKSSKSFRPFGVNTLSDLKNKTVLSNLFNDLIKRFDELTIIDEIPADVSEKDKKELTSYLSFNHWEKLSERKNRNIKKVQIKKFIHLLEKNNLLKTKRILRNRLIAKFKQLLNN